MIRAYFRLYNRHLFPFAQLPQYFPYLSALLSEKYFAPIFRANTMWYLQFHFVCAKLFVSFILEWPPFVL